MKVQLQKTIPVAAGADVAWDFLQQLEAVALCIPGAAITSRVDDRHLKGTVSVRLGPATMSFRGEVEVKEIDPAARTLRLSAKGIDSGGTSGASMDLSTRVEAAGGVSHVVGISEVAINGKAAAFGGRLVEAVAEQVLKQFAENFAAQVAARAAQPPSAPSSFASGACAPGPSESQDASEGKSASNPASELNAPALLWGIFRDRLRALFHRNAA